MPAFASTENGRELSVSQQQQLLALARRSIESGCRNGRPLPLEKIVPLDESAAEWLRQPAACFVTLTLAEQLRGCIGSLSPRRSLALDVSDNAFAAAFRDPRFPPVQAQELTRLCIEIALLSAPVPLAAVADEAALLAQLRPAIDGVVLEQDGRRATFLPKVWSHFDEGRAFLAALRQKAGLPTPFDPAARYSVYQVTAFSEQN
ncbi:AmmeMemoRadiSam system protein A [Permianibacter sp. IMCC34836]|uniref:AmmeMemoRadiSam system protein A n=1 Tax=Permianibacter fluminis TaxID=2738515 RepID=UPI0015582433|nr:AmmeMemoRadiSam system protein A [Permianibacter fluminis]NQD35489.1 AmmeMemoRadiSam system protein A [Permianibacter fluminis]